MKIRTILVALGAGLLLLSCARWSEPEPALSDPESCAEAARKISGYRGLPVRAGARVQQRNDEKWVTFYRVYDECMRERGHTADDIQNSSPE